MNVLKLKKPQTTYTIFSPGEKPGTIENYLLLSIDGMGFLVIKQTIDVEEI